MALGQLRRHCKLVGVLEAQGRQPPQVKPPEELAAHVVQCFRCIAPGRFSEQRDEASSRVLGVQVDGAGAQCLEGDVRSRQVQPALHGQLRPGFQQAREHLRQESVLSEILRTHDDALAARGRSTDTYRE